MSPASPCVEARLMRVRCIGERIGPAVGQLEPSLTTIDEPTEAAACEATTSP